VTYEEWEAGVPGEITGDTLWKMAAYRLALFATDVGWHDVTRLMQDRCTLGLADQLYRALGSVGANLAEGYSRGTGRDRARFYEYALGSARESRDWYYKGRHLLPEALTQHRLQLLTRIIQLLLVAIPQQRQTSGVKRETSSVKRETSSVKREASLEETGIVYQTNPVVAEAELDLLLQNVPFPDDP
jgi:four helix bundle protein